MIKIIKASEMDILQNRVDIAKKHIRHYTKNNKGINKNSTEFMQFLRENLAKHEKNLNEYLKSQNQ